jgi:uncharacterized repeat protein (TIGR03803 family)
MKKVLFALTLMLAISSGNALANAQVYTDLYNFDGTHGADPLSPDLLAQGRDGNLYGTTFRGGLSNLGVVFQITPAGNLNVLHSFTGGADGSYQYGGLVLGFDGSFYGTNDLGGDLDCHSGYGCGTFFRITPSGNLTTLYSFTTEYTPYASPIQAADGNFYGTTSFIAYQITPSGAFTALGALPGQSYAPMLQATDGSLYGVSDGGRYDDGTVFRLTHEGTAAVLFNFNGTDGADPYTSPLIEGTDGNLYGTTSVGGRYKQGTAFKLTPQGLTVLHNFPDPSYGMDGYVPAGLIQASDGNFYGVAAGGGTNDCGVIFRITAIGSYSILYNLDCNSGDIPASPPLQHTNGKIYGLTEAGGTSNDGVVYSFDLGLPPFVRLVYTSGRVAQTGGILGQGFTGTTSVSFNGIPATFAVESDTYLTATVPAGATTGFVTVVTPSGTLTSNQEFQVRP